MKDSSFRDISIFLLVLIQILYKALLRLRKILLCFVILLGILYVNYAMFNNIYPWRIHVYLIILATFILTLIFLNHAYSKKKYYFFKPSDFKIAVFFITFTLTIILLETSKLFSLNSFINPLIKIILSFLIRPPAILAQQLGDLFVYFFPQYQYFNVFTLPKFLNYFSILFCLMYFYILSCVLSYIIHLFSNKSMLSEV